MNIVRLVVEAVKAALEQGLILCGIGLLLLAIVIVSVLVGVIMAVFFIVVTLADIVQDGYAFLKFHLKK